MIGPEIPITIRPEEPSDRAGIRALTKAAFRSTPHSDGTEDKLVDLLRENGDLSLSLVAEDGERVVGHIAFSPVTIEDGATGWFGLGPVSVSPELQRKGIGGALIKRGIADMRAFGARGIVLLGSDEYYPRFGFTHEPQLVYPGAPARYFQCLLIEGELPRGIVTYAPAFQTR